MSRSRFTRVLRLLSQAYLRAAARGSDNPYKWPLLIIATGLFVRLAWVLYIDTVPVSDFAWYEERAWEIANGQGYGGSDGDPTAYRGVGYPAFLAGVYGVWGHSWLAGQMANVIVGTVTVALTYPLARRLVSDNLALVATGIVAFSPSQILYTSVLGTETLFTMLFVVTLIGIIPKDGSSISTQMLVVGGIAMGLSWLVRPTLILFPAALVVLYLISGFGFHRVLKMTAIATVPALIVVTPWIVRNVVQLGEPVLQTSGGEVFWTGNRPDATGTYIALPADDPLNSYGSEVGRNQAGYRLGIDYITSHPTDWISTLPKKFYHLWTSNLSAVNWSTQQTNSSPPAGFITSALVFSQAYWIMLVGPFGFLIFYRSFVSRWLTGPRSIVAIVLFYWTGMFLLFIGEGRYHAPLVPIIAILSVATYARIVGPWLSRYSARRRDATEA